MERKRKEVVVDGQIRLEEVFQPIYSDSLTVYQKNELVRTPKDELSILQCKLMRFVISQIVKDEERFKLFEIDIISLADKLKLRKNHVYETIQSELLSLMTKRIFIRSGNGKRKDYQVFTWVIYAKYEQGRVYIQLNPYLGPYLLGLNKFFDSYNLDAIEPFQRDITVRMYEFLGSMQSMKVEPCEKYGVDLEEDELIFDIMDLKEMFLPHDERGRRIDIYKDNNAFIRRVIEQNLKVIYNNTSMRVDYRVKRKKQADGFHSYVIFRVY